MATRSALATGFNRSSEASKDAPVRGFRIEEPGFNRSSEASKDPGHREDRQAEA